MSKAYEKMEWSFIIAVLKWLDFSKEKKMVSYWAMCLHGHWLYFSLCGLLRKLTHESGPRQGDLLFPYLFIIVSEVLSHLFLREECGNEFHGIENGRHVSSTSYLIFVDDTILFRRATQRDLDVLRKCVEKYQSWSIGQEVYLSKSGVIFSKNFTTNVHKRSGIRLVWK